MTGPEELIAQSRIRDVLVDYCRHLDRMDLEALGALFTEDCRVSYGPRPELVAEGRAALVASLARMWRWKRTAHLLGNVRIWLEEADAARTESLAHAWHEAADGRDAEIFGTYRDVLARREGRWLIRERRMEMLGARGGFRVPIPPAYRHAPPPGWKAPEGLDD